MISTHQESNYSLVSNSSEQHLLPFLGQWRTRCSHLVVHLNDFSIYSDSCRINIQISIVHSASCLNSVIPSKQEPFLITILHCLEFFQLDFIFTIINLFVRSFC